MGPAPQKAGRVWPACTSKWLGGLAGLFARRPVAHRLRLNTQKNSRVGGFLVDWRPKIGEQSLGLRQWADARKNRLASKGATSLLMLVKGSPRLKIR
ncbi:hypothetical protein VTI74DRAFT_11484 [Chaetomium olivicolor]